MRDRDAMPSGTTTHAEAIRRIRDMLAANADRADTMFEILAPVEIDALDHACLVLASASERDRALHQAVPQYPDPEAEDVRPVRGLAACGYAATSETRRMGERE